jgi:hypothetical protein
VPRLARWAAAIREKCYADRTAAADVRRKEAIAANLARRDKLRKEIGRLIKGLKYDEAIEQATELVALGPDEPENRAILENATAIKSAADLASMVGQLKSEIALLISEPCPPTGLLVAMGC